MDDFNFLERTNSSVLSTTDDDPIARYFKIRQRLRHESLESSRASSLSLLSLNKVSFISETPVNNQPNDELLFKKPKTPPVQTKPKDYDFLAPTCSPQTPRFFQDELSSLTPDATTSLNLKDGSLSEFPLRDERDVLNRIENDQKKFVPNASGLSHNSDITHFTEERTPETAIADFENLLEEKENSPPKKNSTISKIHGLLLQNDFSATQICEKLLDRTKNMTIDSKINPSESRHSTPVRHTITTATPLRKARKWVPREPINSSTPEDGTHQQWRQLRQTFLEDQDEPSFNATMKTATTPVKTPGKDILGVVKKLTNLPGGTNFDYSAMTPLVRDKFPGLLENIDEGVFKIVDSVLTAEEFEVPTQSLSASVCVSVKHCVPVPVASGRNWIVVRLGSAEVIIGGKKAKVELTNNTLVVADFLSLRAKEVVLPPATGHILQLSVLCKKPVTAALRITLQATDVHKNTLVDNSFMLFLTAILPTSAFQVPSNTDFGIVPENCFNDRTVKLIYNGECEVPLQLNIPDDIPFKFIRNVDLNGETVPNLQPSDKSIALLLKPGRQVLEFTVQFHPYDIPDIKEKRVVVFQGDLRVDLQTAVPLNLAKMRLQGTAAFAKFLCRSDCSPVVFQAPTPREPISRPFYVKNVGAVPLIVSLTVATDPMNSEEDDEFFRVPRRVAIPLNDMSSFDIVFHPRSGVNHVRRYLIMRLEPNDTTYYDVELIGTITGHESLSSKASVKSGTSSVGSAPGIPVKIASNEKALSWLTTPLRKPVLKTFQVKLKSEISATARLLLPAGAFKIMNDSGEAMQKVRKTLKPGMVVPVTVQFNPDIVGLHVDELTFEFNAETKPSTVSLTGFGGNLTLRIEDTCLDLHGNRMVKLAHPRCDDFVYSSQFRITNYGNVAGFVSILPVGHVLSVTHSLKVYPLQSVIEPGSNVTINLSQHLTRPELRDILAKQDIRKMASLHVIMGDEPSRQRLKKYLSVRPDFDIPQENKNLIEGFPNEIPIHNLDAAKECKNFQTLFSSSLSTCDIAVVVEKLGSTADQTLVDMEETSASFATLSETVIPREVEKPNSEYSTGTHRRKSNLSYLSAGSENNSRKVKDWLKNIN